MPVPPNDPAHDDDARPAREAALIAAVRSGRTDDFAVLVERHQRMIHALARRYLNDADAADEVTQATFVQAFCKLASFRGESSFRTWLCGIALNQCRTLRRTRGARGATLALDDVPEASLASPQHDADTDGLERLVTRLPPRQRAVVTLRVGADLPFREIARIEGITENAAKVSFHRAVTRLRRWLSES